MSLELQYFTCCRAGFRFTETEFRTMPTRRRREYMTISHEWHKQNRDDIDQME